MRAVSLTKSKPEAKDVIARQLNRLMGDDEMGELFKAISISSKGLPTALGMR